MKRLFIFDFDGTLFDSFDDVAVCFNEALTIHGFETLTREEFHEVLGGNIDEIVSLILKDKNTPENIRLVKDTYDELYAKSDKSHTLPFPKTRDFLARLQEEGMMLAINSNRKTDSIKYFVNEYLEGIDFLAIEGHNVGYPSKPAPDGVCNIVEKAKADLDETIYVGDSSTDIQTAKNAGIDCVLVKWGYGDEKDYLDGYPIGVIEDISQLEVFFKAGS